MELKNDEVKEGVEGEDVEETEVETEETDTEPEAKAEGEKKDNKSSESPEDKATRLLRQTNQARKKLGLAALTETKPDTKSSKKSDGLDYGEKAFLSANGIKGSKEFEFVQKELKASGEDLDTLLENDYFKSRLEKFRNLNKTAEATIKGKRSNGVATDSVEYWASKPIEEVPVDMRIKVVNHKLDKEKNKGVFYNSNK